MRALQHRHQFLPLVAPSIGVVDSNWGELWEAVRRELGVSFEAGHLLMSAPLESGTPGRRALDSQEAGRWLRALLDLNESELQGRKVSSHSMKSTMLSFLAKRGVDMPDRLLLGYLTFHHGFDVQQRWHGKTAANLDEHAGGNPQRTLSSRLHAQWQACATGG